MAASTIPRYVPLRNMALSFDGASSVAVAPAPARFAGTGSFTLSIVASFVPGIGPPTVASISPCHGPPGGGTAVQISGTGFWGTPAVTIGPHPLEQVSSITERSILGISPPGKLGPADVIVTNPDGTGGILVGGFTYGDHALAALPPAPLPGATANLDFTMGIFGIVDHQRAPVLALWLDAAGRLHVRFQATESIVDVAPLAGTWITIGVVFDAVALTLTTYVDDVLSVVDHVAEPVQRALVQTLWGTTGRVADGCFRGRLGTTRLWNRPLSRREILDTAFDTNIGPVSRILDPLGVALVASWRLNEGFGDVAYDYASLAGSDAILGAKAVGEIPNPGKPEWVIAVPHSKL